MDSHTSPSNEVDPARQELAIQEAWLYNMLPPSPTVCAICRGATKDGYRNCYPCSETLSQAGGVTADAVVPISYAPDDGQHYHDLKVYKSPYTPSRRALRRLAILNLYFTREHAPCLDRVSGGLTHIATVPSTREREGVHPLRQIVELLYRSAPFIEATANPKYGNERGFRKDRFEVAKLERGKDGPPRVLLLEDLWVSGGRAQSMAYALKKAGAASVVIVALGRRITPTYGPSGPLLEAVKRTKFNLGYCAIDDLPQ